MNFVLDASVALAWAFEDEGGEYAHYLELAIRYGIPLATLNDGLRQAAEEEGIRGPLT